MVNCRKLKQKDIIYWVKDGVVEGVFVGVYSRHDMWVQSISMRFPGLVKKKDVFLTKDEAENHYLKNLIDDDNKRAV